MPQRGSAVRVTQIDFKSLLRDSATLPRTTVLVRESGLRALLLHLHAGESMAEHKTPGAMTVQSLQGEIAFSAGEETFQLTPGVLISLPPHQPHSLRAEQEALLLVTLSEQLKP